MHRTPAVSYRVVRSVQHLALNATLWGIGLVSLSMFGATQPLSWIEILAVYFGALLSGAIALWGWQRSPVGLLRWDGTYWYWDGFTEESACNLVLRMDLQGLLLVTVASPVGQETWLWLARDADDAQWRALRRAVVA